MPNNKQKPYYLIDRMKFILCCIFFLNTSFLLAQNNPPPGTTFNVEIGQYFEQQFTFAGPPVGVWSSNLNFATTGLSMSSTGLLSGYPEKNINCIDFNVLRDGADAEIYHICIRRPGANIMIVLDKSGSMNQSSGADTKWNVLKQCVNSFLTSLRGWDEDQVKDSLGVIYFSHERSDFQVAGTPGLQLFNNPPSIPINITDISNDMNGQTVAGTTCIGGALLAAYDEFANAAVDSGTIILFSDGMQNRNPKIDESTMVINNDGISASVPDFASFSVPFNLAQNRKFKIHTICIGDLTLASLMQNISTANTDNNFDGTYQPITSSAGFILTLNDMFDNLLIADFGPFSPAIVDKSINTIQKRTLSKQFHVNNSATRILIKAVGENVNRETLKMKVEKDSIDFTSFVKYDGSFIYFFAEKDTIEARGGKMGGDWNVTFTGQENILFSATCIIDDKYLDYECSLENPNPEPGDILKLNLKVSAKELPVTDLTTAKAYVLKPGQDLNDLFSFADLPTTLPKDWPSEPDNLAGQDKFEKLIALDTAFVNALKPIESIFDLSNNGDGSYSGQFTDTKESGVYRIIFKFIGNEALEGTYERYYMLTRVIDFGLADENNTIFQIDWNFLSRHFTIKPVNKFGHLIGPNRLGSIILTMDGKQLELVDNLDGTYSAKPPFFTLFKRNAIVKLDIKSNTYTETKYKDIPGVVLWKDILIELGILILIILLLIILLKKIIFNKKA